MFFYLTFNLLCVSIIEIRYFALIKNCITLKDSGLVLVVVELILIPPQILWLKHMVLSETKASNTTACVAVTSGDITGGGGVLA